MADKDSFFKPAFPAVRLLGAHKAALTDRTAKGMISAEVTAREQKTAYLRKLRLEQQNQAASAESE